MKDFIDLQWFAAEDEGRTQDPTDITFRKAREEGRVAKSQELIAAIVLLLPAISIIFLAPHILRTCAEMLRFFITRSTELDPTKDRIIVLVFFNYFIPIALPIMIVAMVSAFFSNFIQVGALFSTKPLEPDFSRILPKFGRYFQRTLFSIEALFNLGKSIFKMAIIGLVAFLIVSSRFHELVNLQRAGLWNGLTLVAGLAAQLLVITAVLLLILSIPDVVFQKWQFKQSLKMTPQAAKEELKQEDGDPEVRRRLRSRYREVLSRSQLAKVPEADVVITNPTHYSVALYYDISQMTAPKVIAKGEDDFALQIREIAREHGVPVVSHPPLTRALYQETEIDEQIPFRYWKVVVLVLGRFFNIEQKQEKARRMAARAAREEEAALDAALYEEMA